jgi:hypothetical protein
LRSRFFVPFVVLVLTACSGGPRYVRAGSSFDVRAPATRYHVGVLSESWRPLDVAAQNDLAFSAARLDAVVQANSRCDAADDDVPLESLTQHLLIGFTERQYSDEATQPMDDREARFTHVVAKLDGVSRELLLVVLKKDGCVYDLSLIAPHDGRFGMARPDFDAFVHAFHAEPREGHRR